MPETFYAIYDIATGALRSTGSVVTKTDQQLAAEGRAKKVIARQLGENDEWDQALLDIKPRVGVISAKVRTPPAPFYRPPAAPTNKDILDGLTVIYNMLADLLEKKQ